MLQAQPSHHYIYYYIHWQAIHYYIYDRKLVLKVAAFIDWKINNYNLKVFLWLYILSNYKGIYLARNTWKQFWTDVLIATSQKQFWVAYTRFGYGFIHFLFSLFWQAWFGYSIYIFPLIYTTNVPSLFYLPHVWCAKSVSEFYPMCRGILLYYYYYPFKYYLFLPLLITCFC